jgi:SAM-dependent methyltransferase
MADTDNPDQPRSGWSQMPIYDRDFYEMQVTASARAADVVVPIVLELLRVRSVCDVGCGVGAWLNAFAKQGVSDLLGIDGDYVEPEMLQIPSAYFQRTDLEKPFRLHRNFDLAVCLEVAEHLPPSRAESFVEDLTHLAPTILFSAALPHQGGVNHVNEQYLSWWAKIFERHGFGVCDVIRSRIWDNTDLIPCYRQNIVIFARSEIISSNPLLVESRIGQVDLVHPLFYSRMLPSDNAKVLARHLWWAINRDCKRWLKTWR